eukprot:SAG11_NODE_2325_length_3521_cov_4.278995_4_plen_107_part_00
MWTADDQAKTMLEPFLGTGPLAHIGASGIAGTASAMTSTPADVLKTRLMDDAGREGGQRYRGIVHAATSVVRGTGWHEQYLLDPALKVYPSCKITQSYSLDLSKKP